MPAKRCLALIALSSICLSGFAQAADLGAKLPPPPPLPVDTGPAGGWYLRGDFGYSISNDPKMQLSIDGAKYDYSHAKMGNAGTFGAGVGYRFASWLRVDGTIDYRSNARLNGVYSSIGDPSVGREDTKASITAVTGLVNAYVDLGTWSGLTPYVGAGVGASSVKFGGYSGTDYIGPTYPHALTGCGSTAPVDAQGGRTFASCSVIGSRNKANLAWALMAGTAIELGGGLSIDVGYRYINYGESASGYDSVSLPAKLKITTKDIDAHEVRVGLRWALGGDVGQPALPTLVRKY